MIIAELKKKENIIEYIIYMLQIQDILRGNNFDIERIDTLIINNYKIMQDQRMQVREWYLSLISAMKNEGIEKSGKLSSIKEILEELNTLNQALLSDKNNYKHNGLYAWAQKNIEEFKELSKSKTDNEIEICIDAMYALFLLRIQKKPISDETAQAMQTFSNLLANLANVYKIIHNNIS